MSQVKFMKLSFLYPLFLRIGVLKMSKMDRMRLLWILLIEHKNTDLGVCLYSKYSVAK